MIMTITAPSFKTFNRVNSVPDRLRVPASFGHFWEFQLQIVTGTSIFMQEQTLRDKLVPSYHLGKSVLFCSPLCFPAVGAALGCRRASAHLSLVLSGRSCWGRCGIRGQRGCHRPSDRRWVEALLAAPTMVSDEHPPWCAPDSLLCSFPLVLRVAGLGKRHFSVLSCTSRPDAAQPWLGSCRGVQSPGVPFTSSLQPLASLLKSATPSSFHLAIWASETDLISADHCSSFLSMKHYSHSLKGLGFSSSGKCGGFAWELGTYSALVLLYFALSAHLHL